MKRTFTGLAVALSALVGGLPASRAGEDASGTPLSVLLENIEGTAGTESTSGPRARVTLSGTQVRTMLAEGRVPPPEFSRPEVAAVLIEAQRAASQVAAS